LGRYGAGTLWYHTTRDGTFITFNRLLDAFDEGTQPITRNHGRPSHGLFPLNRTEQIEQLVLCLQDESQRPVNGGLNRAASLDRVNEPITLFRTENMNGLNELSRRGIGGREMCYPLLN
jgi:hypothetical protein